MDYKKIIAVTAVTSAAFVVPAVVGAEETITPSTDLITGGTYSLGDTVKLSIQEFEQTTPGENGEEVITTDKIVSYEWYVGDVTVASSKAAQFNVPIHANGKDVKLIVTTASGAKYTQTVPVAALEELQATYGAAKVNSTLTLSGISISPNTEIISSYEWYVIENGQFKLLVGETDLELDIPIEFSGKELLFVINTESGKKFKKSIQVETLELDVANVTFNTKVNGNLVVNGFDKLLPGDQIEITDFEILGKGNEILTPEDYTIQYKWLAENQAGNLIALSNTTGYTLLVPIDSEKKEYKGFQVRLTLAVPGVNFSGELGTISLELESANPGILDGVEAGIAGLEFITTFDDLKTKIEELQESYSALNATAKLSISNYAVLNSYSQALKIVEPLTEQLSKLQVNYDEFLANNTTLTQAELLKQANTLRQSINKLTATQKKVFGYVEEANGSTVVQLHEWIVKFNEGADYLTDKAVIAYNDKVSDIYDEQSQTYLIEFIENTQGDEDNFVSLTAFEKLIKQQLDEAKTINKAYHSLLKLDVLKTAQSDIKKARKAVEAINKITATTDLKKKASAIIAAEKAYNKLSLAQSTLISELTKELLTNPYTDDEKEALENTVPDTILALNERIAEMLPVDNAYSSDIETLEFELAEIAVEYKLLTSAQKKLVTNYKSVSQVKKDVSAAKRVLSSLLKAEEALEASQEFVDSKYVSKIKSAQSKYNSAYKAYLKLTIAQKSLTADLAVEEGLEGVTSTMDDEQFAGKQEYDSAKSSALVAHIEDIKSQLQATETAGLSLTGSDSITDLQQSIEKAKLDYKGLTSFEKKLVHNYALVSTASKHLSKANSAKKRLVAVTDAKKFTSAKEAFDKLQPVEKGLIIGTYLEVAANHNISSASLAVLDARLTEYLSGGFYDIEVFKELQKEIQFFSTKELKTLTNYNAYQNLVKDVKAVDSFAAKMQKLGENPSYSQKNSIYKSYQKLTQTQQKLFESYLTSNGDLLIDQLNLWMEEAPSIAKDLNSRIGDIIVNGNYSTELIDMTGDALAELDSFEQSIEKLNNEYKALDSKERKLVVNYSYLKAAEKDSKAVRNVVKLEMDLQKEITEVETDSGKETVYGPKAVSIQNKLKKAKDKLTFEQVSLYDLLTTTVTP